MPTWEERVFAPEITVIEAVIFALTAAAMALSIAWAIYTAANWRHKIIRSSSPSFLVIMIVGALLSFATIYTWNLTYISVSTCVLRVWFLNIGKYKIYAKLSPLNVTLEIALTCVNRIKKPSSRNDQFFALY
jgi:hypothetical protein